MARGPLVDGRNGVVRTGGEVEFWAPERMHASALMTLRDADAWLTREYTLALYVLKLLGQNERRERKRAA